MGATPQGTLSYFTEHPGVKEKATLGRTGWNVTHVGFGSYRIDDETAEHRRALELALTTGCNLIDTSTNYSIGASERVIGKVLQDLFAGRKLKREQVVVVTKIGYVQGENLEIAQKRKAEGDPFPEMVEYQPGCWHCISPEFLEDQLNRSLQRLGVDQIDVLLLHNPEYFLMNHGSHAEYYRRIGQAFEYLETQVRKKRIQYYGISSNTFPEPKASPTYTSLEVAHEIAENIDPGHHFAVIQFPMNLYEPGAVLEDSNSGLSVAEFARRKNLGTLVNRPLNAFSPRGLIRLASIPEHEGEDTVGNLRRLIDETARVEAEFKGQNLVPARLVAWAHFLVQNLDRFNHLDDWKGFLQYRIRPALKEAMEALKKEEAHQEWAAKYESVSEKLFQAVTAVLEAQSAQTSTQISRLLDRLRPELRTSPTLSQKVIRIYRSLSGISSILVGMREERYVRDSLSLEPALASEEALDVLRAIQPEL